MPRSNETHASDQEVDSKWGAAGLKAVSCVSSMCRDFFQNQPGVLAVKSLNSLFQCTLLVIALAMATALFSQPSADASQNSKRYDYTPNRVTRRSSQSILLNKDWRDSIEIIANRGEGKVDFLEKFLSLTDPQEVVKMKGYRDPAHTRFEFWAYEVRSQEALARIELLLEKGYSALVVADAEPVDETQAVKNGRDNTLTIAFWNKLKRLQKKFPAALELQTNPYETEPTAPGRKYKRMQHIKMTSISLKKSGKWVRQVAMLSSANLTEACLRGRISMSAVNIPRYLNGKSYALAKGTEGHIQFGMIVRGEKEIRALEGPLDSWLGYYRVGLPFDQQSPSILKLPRVAFLGKNGEATHSGNPHGPLPSATTIQAFYSEGMPEDPHAQRVQTVDPNWAVTEILSQPGIELTEFYMGDFAVTHIPLALHLRHHLASGTVKKMGIYVDGNFSVAPYSALPYYLFAPGVDDAPYVLPRHSIQNFTPISADLNWQNHVFSFQGEVGVFGGGSQNGESLGDKLHAKTRYFVYNLRGETHYLVVFGSGNNSGKAGKYNADVTFLLDSVDPSLDAQVRPFFESLAQEKRMFRYALIFIERRFAEMFNPSEKIFTADFEFISKFEKLLNGAQDAPKFKWITETLRSVGSSSELGDNFLKILDWWIETRKADSTKRLKKFDWAEFSLALRLANIEKVPPTGFVEDLKKRWIGEKPGQELSQSYRALIRSLYRTPEAGPPPQPRTVDRIVQQCLPLLTRYGLSMPLEGAGESR